MKATREELLNAHFKAMHLHGFQGMRTDKVIQELSITKGAFYHYFPDKITLGYAIVEEILRPQYLGLWKTVEQHPSGVIDGILAILAQFKSKICTSDESAALGCPLNNLIQEMSPLDEGFHNRLQFIIAEERRMLRQSLKAGVQQGHLPAHLVVDDVTLFILASIQGAFAIGKALKSKTAFDQIIGILELWVSQLAKQSA